MPHPKDYIFEQRAIDSGNVLFRGIDQHHPLHADQDQLHVRRRIVLGIWTKLQPQKLVAGFALPRACRSRFHRIRTEKHRVAL